VDESTGRGVYFDKDQRICEGRGVEHKFGIINVVSTFFGVDVDRGSNVVELKIIYIYVYYCYIKKSYVLTSCFEININGRMFV